MTDERADSPLDSSVGSSLEQPALSTEAQQSTRASSESVSENTSQQTAVKAPAARPAQASATAVAATVALVVFSVFIGVYGPRLGNRQQLPAGTTLVELAAAIEPRHAQRVIEATHRGSSTGFQRPARASDASESAERDPSDSATASGTHRGEWTRVDAEESASKIVGSEVLLPELDGFAVRWLEPSRVRLPGASGAMVFCAVAAQGIDPRRWPLLGEFASISILDDEDRFTLFDSFGRPIPFPEGEVFSVTVREGRDPAVVKMFRVRDLVYAVQASDEDLASELVAELQLRAAAERAGKRNEPSEPVERTDH